LVPKPQGVFCHLALKNFWRRFAPKAGIDRVSILSLLWMAGETGKAFLHHFFSAPID